MIGKINKSISGKLVFRLSLFLIFLLIVVEILFGYEFRKESIRQTKLRATEIAKTVRDALTSLMVMGVIQDRESFIDRLKDLKSLKDIRIIRGEAVDKQFGPGYPNERPIDEYDKEVLATGKPVYKLYESLNKVEYRVVYPYVASSQGKVNCLQCHAVKDGEVLGAISMTFDISSLRYNSFVTIVQTTLVFLLFLVLIALLIYKFSKPYIDLFNTLKQKLSLVEKGEFDEGFLDEDKLPEDEAGEVGKKFNETIKTLGNTLSYISEKVSFLIGYSVIKTNNYLKDTLKIVAELSNIQSFKKTIEKDRDKNDIYMRIRQVIEDYMSLEYFSLYELKGDKLIPVFVKSFSEGQFWCKNVIFEDSDMCRAKRIGEDVDSTEFPCICPSFNEDKCGKINYFCIPFYLSGKVGGILQIVYEEDVKDFIKMMIPYVKGYLTEASPVIETKILMEQLKEQSMVDQLTGLKNRRFIENAIDTIIAGLKRRNSKMCVMMVDADHFKEVNDTYGHDNGDIVLKHIAKILRSSVRDSDIVIRFGGEEFLVLLMDLSDDKKCLDIAEKIRKNIEDSPVKLNDGTVLRKTVSIGYSVFPDDSDKFWQLVKFADVALYHAKETGRNKVVKFTKELWKNGEEY